MSSTPDSESGQPATAGGAASTAQARAEEAAALAQTLAATLSGILDSISEKLADLEVFGKEDHDDIVHLKTYNRRHNHIVIGLVVSLVVDITLSVFTILLGIGLDHQNSAQRASLLSVCQANNVTRAAEIAIWKRNIQDFENNAVGRSFIKEVEAANAPVDCVKRYGG